MPCTKHQGGVTVGFLKNVDVWEAELIISLRLWYSGLGGRADVYEVFSSRFSSERATKEFETFECLLNSISIYAHRPLFLHDVECSCIGADEQIFVHLVATASSGDLSEAVLMATLLIGAAQAENIALLAAQVGQTAKEMSPTRTHVHVQSLRKSAQLH